MAIQDIYNCILLEDGTALSGMPQIGQCAEVRDAGYDAVINLAPEDAEGALAGEAAIWSGLSLSYVNIPVPWNGPTLEQLDQFIAVMEDARPARVLVHCQANFRVTAFYGLYAIHSLGWTRDRAQQLIDQVWRSRPDYEMEECWRRFIALGMARGL